MYVFIVCAYVHICTCVVCGMCACCRLLFIHHAVIWLSCKHLYPLSHPAGPCLHFASQLSCCEQHPLPCAPTLTYRTTIGSKQQSQTTMKLTNAQSFLHPHTAQERVQCPSIQTPFIYFAFYLKYQLNPPCHNAGHIWKQRMGCSSVGCSLSTHKALGSTQA